MEATGLINICTEILKEVISLNRAHTRCGSQVVGTRTPIKKGKVRGFIYAGWVKKKEVSNKSDACDCHHCIFLHKNSVFVRKGTTCRFKFPLSFD